MGGCREIHLTMVQTLTGVAGLGTTPHSTDFHMLKIVDTEERKRKKSTVICLQDRSTKTSIYIWTQEPNGDMVSTPIVWKSRAISENVLMDCLPLLALLGSGPSQTIRKTPAALGMQLIRI
jgi:hypothetical protein